MEGAIRDKIRAAAAALRNAGAREVYVFGSAASERMRADSDVDLAVVGLPPENFFRAMSLAREALGRDVDMIDLDLDNAFTRYLKEEGELVHVA